LCHDGQPIQSSKAEQSIAQVVLFDQQEHGEDQNNSEYSQRREKGLGEVAHILKFGGWFFDNLHCERTARLILGIASAQTTRGSCRSGCRWSAGKLLPELLDGRGGPSQWSFVGGTHRFNLVVNVLLVSRQLVSYLDQLIEDHQADPACGRDGDNHHQEY